MSKRWLTTLSAAALLAGLTACGETPAEDDAAMPQAETSTQGEPQAADPAPEETSMPAPIASNTPMSGPTSTSIAADADPGECNAGAASRFVGQVALPAKRAEVIEAVGHNRIRWIAPDTVVTQDFRPDRLNVSLDAGNRITGARCG